MNRRARLYLFRAFGQFAEARKVLLPWACIGGGLIAGALLLVGGSWLGRKW